MKIYLDTVGCRLNQSEIEKMARQFRAAGHEIVANAGEADLAVINTCTVTSRAASDSRQKVRQAARLGAGEIVLTGCWSTLEPEQARDLPGVSRLIPNLRKDQLVSDILGIPEHEFDLEPLARQPLPGSRKRTRAFIKVQDGCDNHCTFCITTLARGKANSRSIASVLQDITSAQLGGAQEAVLTGVHLGSWGRDFENKSAHLAELIRSILAETDLDRLRLSSLEPWDLDEDFFGLWSNARLCRHLHLPLQSGSAGVLKRMARKVTPDSYANLLASARAAIPDVSISTDLIAGFPGETEEEFSETMQFVEAMQFSGGHVFTYSARPGTAAARMAGQVPNIVRKKRAAALREVLSCSNRSYNDRFVGSTVQVLWESCTQITSEKWQLDGLTDNYLNVHAMSTQPRWNQFDLVELVGIGTDGLNGEILG
jgi:threonylcarbamoyladenosine tRNA methylthiotransferase MtaB